MKKLNLILLGLLITATNSPVISESQEIEHLIIIPKELRLDFYKYNFPEPVTNIPIADDFEKTQEIVVNWDDLREVSNISIDKANELLYGELKGYGKYFVKAEEDYGINAVFLMALARLESGNGTYALMKYNNIFSFGAFDDNIYQAVRFDSIEQCIDHVAEYIKNEYLTEGGKYFNGYSIKDINKRYASDDEWYLKIMRMF